MVCSTLARLDLMRVPLPAARTAAKVGASWRSNTGFHDSYPYDIDAQGCPGTTLAGAAGFEPAIPGPKPGALPLGYAPSRTPRSRLSQDRPQLSRLYRSLSRVSAKDLRLQSARGRRLLLSLEVEHHNTFTPRGTGSQT